MILFLFSASVFSQSAAENDDIRIEGLSDIGSVESSWDNPNAWSLEDDPDIIKVISTQLRDASGKKIKNSSIDTPLTISIHIPESVREGYADSDYSIVVFDGTDVRQHIEAEKNGDWLRFSWNTVEDFGVVVNGAGSGEAGALTLVGQSRSTLQSVDFKRMFIILGIFAGVCIPFMTIYSWRRVKREMIEDMKAEAANRSQVSEDSEESEEFSKTEEENSNGSNE